VRVASVCSSPFRSWRTSLATLLMALMFANVAAAQVGAPRAPATGDDAKGEVDEDEDEAEKEKAEFKLLGQDPWIDVGVQAAAIFAGAAGGAALAGGVLAFATYASGAYALTSAEIVPLLSLALGGVAAVALPSGGVLLAATLTGANWMRGAPAAVLAALLGLAGLIPGAIVGGIAGTAIAGAIAVGSGETPVGIGQSVTPLAVGAAVGGAAAASIACMFGAGVGFAGGLTADYLIHDGFEGDE
jgi:hypothetical protein